MRKIFVFIIVSMLCSCVMRPITNNERKFISGIFENTIDYNKIELVKGKNNEAYKILEEEANRILDANPKLKAANKGIPNIQNIGGITIGNTIYFPKNYYKPDFLLGYPSSIDISSIPLFGHEIFHVWQFQNSNITNYSLKNIILEWLTQENPYLYDIDETTNGKPKKFLAYRYEQQAQIFNDYISLFLLINIVHQPGVNIELYGKLKNKLEEIIKDPELVANDIIKKYNDKKIGLIYY